MAHIPNLDARHGSAHLHRCPTMRRSSQFFPGAALYQQWNEIAHGAQVKQRVHALDYSRNMIVRKVCVFLGKTTL
jgi:hypothetical protein